MQLREFIEQGRCLVKEISPQLRLLLVEPERDDLLLSVTVRGGELFALFHQHGSALGLAHLLAPVAALGNVLERAKLGYLQLSTRHISLFMEICSFIDQGFSLILQEGSDLRLAASATALEAAIEESLHTALPSSSENLAFIGGSNEMREAFFLESEQLLITAEQEFVLWDFIAIDHQRVAELCRTLRRLKENFSIYDCQDFGRLCMALESTLNRYMQGEFFQTEYPERTFLRCIDSMRESFSRFALSEIFALPQVEELLQAVQGLIRQPLGELLIEAGLVNPQTVDDALSLQRAAPASQPRRLGEVLVGMGEVTPEEVAGILDRQQSLQQQIKREEELAAGDAQESGAIVPLLPAEVSVDGHKLARVVSVVKQLTSMELPEELIPFVQELDHLTRNMSLGADHAFSHYLQRVVRDLSLQYSKRVHFRLEGAEVMHNDLDMAAFSEILLPLLRNSVEHGIEPSEQRQRIQKKKNGRVTLSALRQGEELWISVEDDGAGFDMKKIARLCLEQELIAQEDLGQTTEAELLQIFLNNQNCDQKPMPVDAQPCTGLAVVKDMLQDYHAKMDIWSRPTRGARVTLRIPRPS